MPSQAAWRIGALSGQVTAKVTSAAHSGTPTHYDVITIGSGGGAKVSTPAANLGFKVAMVEHGYEVRLPTAIAAREGFGATSVEAASYRMPGLGGTCLNRGCIPSKMLIHPADVLTELRESDRFGIEVDTRGINFESLVNSSNTNVDGDSFSIVKGYNENNKLPDTKHLYQGTAKFVGPKTLEVTPGRNGEASSLISADYIFLAAGAEPSVPDIPGLAGTPYLTSTEALRLTKLPNKIILIGAGYIACELGHMFGAFGAEVHMMARSELLRTVDAEAKKEFQRVFESRYSTHSGVKFDRVEHNSSNGLFTLYYTDKDGAKQVIENADQLLISTGVNPAGLYMDMEKTGVQLREGGFVKVDDRLATTCPGIWSFGDMAGNYMFRHCANFEGDYLLENVIHPMAEARKRKGSGLSVTGVASAAGGNIPIPNDYPPIDYTGMPWAVFSNPQVSGVGMSEEEVQAAGLSYVKGVNAYRSSAMGDARLSDHGFVKLLIERGTRKILGCVIVGYEASTMIHAVCPLMRLGGKLDDILYTIWIHPALPEILRNAGRKARDALVDAGDDIPLKLKIK